MAASINADSATITELIEDAAIRSDIKTFSHQLAKAFSERNNARLTSLWRTAGEYPDEDLEHNLRLKTGLLYRARRLCASLSTMGEPEADTGPTIDPQVEEDRRAIVGSLSQLCLAETVQAYTSCGNAKSLAWREGQVGRFKDALGVLAIVVGEGHEGSVQGFERRLNQFLAEEKAEEAGEASNSLA